MGCLGRVEVASMGVVATKKSHIPEFCKSVFTKSIMDCKHLRTVIGRIFRFVSEQLFSEIFKNRPKWHLFHSTMSPIALVGSIKLLGSFSFTFNFRKLIREAKGFIQPPPPPARWNFSSPLCPVLLRCVEEKTFQNTWSASDLVQLVRGLPAHCWPGFNPQYHIRSPRPIRSDHWAKNQESAEMDQFCVLLVPFKIDILNITFMPVSSLLTTYIKLENNLVKIN